MSSTPPHEASAAIGGEAPEMRCGDDMVGVLFALALARCALLSTGGGSLGRRLERKVTRHFHALPKDAEGVSYDLVSFADLRRSPIFDGRDADAKCPRRRAPSGPGRRGWPRAGWSAA